MGSVEKGGNGGGLGVLPLAGELGDEGSEIGGLLGSHLCLVPVRGPAPLTPSVWPTQGEGVNRYFYPSSFYGNSC